MPDVQTTSKAVLISKSNYGKPTTYSLGKGSTNNMYSYNATTIWLDCYNSDINTVDLLKEKLAKMPMKLHALLVEPIDIECTDEQSEILEKIKNEANTYQGTTHIYSTDNISPNFKVIYKKSNLIKINDIETRLALLESEG
jgi:hypothetical protein